MSNPLVSICVSAYDIESHLRETLESILAQTYERFELVLLDNGSTDGTAAIIRSFDDPRIRTLELAPNIGGYEGMNYAISRARGELIAVYHSDDVYDPEIVAREVAFLDEHPEAGAVFTMDHYIDEDGVRFGGTSVPAELGGTTMLSHERLFRHMLRHKNTVLRCPTFMARATVLAEVGVFAPEQWDIASDTELWLRLSRSHPIGVIDERLVSYRVRRDNWSARYERLRTDPERHFAVLDHYLALEGPRVATPGDLREHEFHRCDDETSRAVNHLFLRQWDEARTLLRHRYAPATFLAGFHRRKLKTLVLRAVLRTALVAHVPGMLTRVLAAAGYRGQLA